MYILVVCYLMWLSRVSGVKNITQGVARHLRSVSFPDGSGMGIFMAIGLPLDIPNKSIQVSFYFEANYGLPDWNSSYYLDDHFAKRSLNRRLAYEVIVNKLESLGFSGEGCLQKMICEVANNPLTNNGVIGDVLQILLTPSSSENENLPSKITEAEYMEDCNNQYKNCPQSPLALISHQNLNGIS
ncbi:uncharacterized protein LOC105663919 [Megachile rotundata]|uniref:uncharacterized protein LOC105663919 n=1 Tax=Megachile rotundata TaxID=143995 RepID=UPI000614E936|nr:PREDICTED: uncharacterized protein LOC105663919 [Megachile rotundata]